WTLLCDVLGVGLLFVEGLDPATDMAVTPLDGAERRLVEGLDSASVALFEGDCHQRFESCGRTLVVPAKGEDEALVLHDLTIDSAEPAFAMLDRLDHRAISAADTKIDARFWAGKIFRTHPALQVLHARPQCEHERGWCRERADDKQLIVSDLFLGSHHRLFPSGHRGRPPSCRSSPPRSADRWRASRRPPRGSSLPTCRAATVLP